MAICTNAARSCCHVLEPFIELGGLPFAGLQVSYVSRREDILADLYVQGAAVIAGVILLLNIWSGKRSGYALNPRKEMQDVRRCMELLRISERR